jgi:hypothetical protein
MFDVGLYPLAIGGVDILRDDFDLLVGLEIYEDRRASQFRLNLMGIEHMK